MVLDARMTLAHHDALGRPCGAEAVLKVMDKYRIEAAVLVSAMAVDVDIRQGNEELAEAIEPARRSLGGVGSSPRLFGCLVANPAYPEETIELMRSAMSSPKFVALGLFRGASQPYPNIDDYREIINAYRRFTKPILVHTPNGESVESAVEIATQFPGIKFILGAMGGADWRRTLPHAKQLNLILETAGSFDAEKIEMAVSEYGEHRVIFGSGFPYSDVPPMLALIQSSGKSKDSLAKVLGENARAIFNLGPSR